MSENLAIFCPMIDPSVVTLSVRHSSIPIASQTPGYYSWKMISQRAISLECKSVNRQKEQKETRTAALLALTVDYITQMSVIRIERFIPPLSRHYECGIAVNFSKNYDAVLTLRLRVPPHTLLQPALARNKPGTFS